MTKIKNQQTQQDKDEKLNKNNTDLSDRNKNTEEKKQVKVKDKEDLAQKVLDLEKKIAQCEQAKLRVLADYQNLQKRQIKDFENFKKKLIKDMVLSLADPIENLKKAVEQLEHDRQVLDMIFRQFEGSLKNLGVSKIDCLGKDFDVKTMEAVGKTDKGQKVKQVVSEGYTYQGEVIKHAKVILD